MLTNKIFDTISDVIIVFDEESMIIDVSHSVKDVFQYSREELINQPIDIVLPERFRKSHREMFNDYIKNPLPRRMGTRSKLFALDKNGDEFYVDIALSHYKQEEKNLYVAVIRNISDIIHTQNRLESLNNELSTRNKELDQFTNIVSHDLKAPTHSIIGLINIIQNEHKEKLNDDALQCFSLIQQTSKRMGELIDGILNYSRAGQVDTELLKFNLKHLIQEVLENLDIPREFKTEIDCANIEIHTNKVQLLQVLSNLIGNAVKYHNKKAGAITIICRKVNDEVEISVKDDGPGIPENYHSTIFEMFGIANEKRRSDSTGIGLAIVKKLVDQNGGAIRVNSIVNKGSEFIFTWKSTTVNNK